MKLILIDHMTGPGCEGWIRAAGDFVSVEIDPQLSIFQLARKANQIARGFEPGEQICLLINLHLVTNDIQHRTDQCGAEFLEVIRYATDFGPNEPNLLARLPCIVHGVFSLETALRNKPNQVILTSPGTWLVETFDSESLKETLKQISPIDDASFSSWIHRLKSTFTFESQNHSVANWWGVIKIAEVTAQLGGHPINLWDSLSTVLTDTDNLRAQAFNRSAGNHVISEALTEKIQKLRASLRIRKLRILHIDDEWEKGWSRAFAEMILYPANDELQQTSGVERKCSDEATACSYEEFSIPKLGSLRAFKSFPSESVDTEEFVEKIFPRLKCLIELWRPHLILLDLRLTGNAEEGKKISESSGVRLVKKLREFQKGLPIIMTTASNKAWSMSEILKSGADAYWMKEGLTGNSPGANTIENYKMLLDFVSKATDLDYSFLRVFSEHIEKHMRITPNGRWYSNPPWPQTLTDEEKEAHCRRIDAILSESLDLLRSYLHHEVMDYGYSGTQEGRHRIASIVTHIFRAIEVIHNPSNVHRNGDPVNGALFSIKAVMDARNDTQGNKIRRIRNNFAHLNFIFNNQPVTFEDLEGYLIAVYAYLEVEPILDPNRTAYYKEAIDHIVEALRPPAN